MGQNRVRKSLEFVEENFLTQMVDSQMVGDGLPDLLLRSKEELDRDVTINSSRGRSDYKEPQM